MKQEGYDDQVPNTTSGRVYKRPNYLKDYDESGKHHAESDEEDFNESDQSEDEDDSGDDYVDKKYHRKNKKKGKAGKYGQQNYPYESKRQKVSDSDFINMQANSRANKKKPTDGIELQGNLLLVYKRNAQNRTNIDNLNIVLKGLWRLQELKTDA